MAHFKEFIPQAFVGGNSMILDAEVLLIDTNTSKPLPFGTLGVHKVSMPAKCIFPLTSLWSVHLFGFAGLSVWVEGVLAGVLW